MDIVFVNQDSGYLTIDIVNSFVNSHKFDKVSLVAGWIIESERLENSVEVIRIAKYHKNSNVAKLLSSLQASISISFLLLTKFKNSFVFFISNPALVVFTPVRNIKYSFLVYDIFPDSLFVAGLIKKTNLLYKIWYKRNITFFGKAQRVFTISESMKHTLTQYCPNEKISFVPLWGRTFVDVPSSRRDNSFVNKYSIPDKFVVMYSGTIGVGHNVESLVELANLLKDNDKILFIIVGDGSEKVNLEKKIRHYQLNNCMLLPFQPVEDLSSSLSCADFGVVTVNGDISKMSIPSKTFSLINLGVPLLCISKEDSEISKMIKEFNVGYSTDDDHLADMAKVIDRCSLDNGIMKVYKENMVKCKNHFTKSNASVFVDELI